MHAFLRHSAAVASAAIFLCLPGACLAAGAAQQNPTSFTGLQIQGDKPISIESDSLDVDDRNTVATFTGNVSVEQGDVLLRTSKLLVHYKRKPGSNDGSGKEAPVKAGALPGGSSQIERLDATGKVYVKSTDQVATADQASFDMASQLVTMTGDVVLTQGKNVAQGCRLTIRMDTGAARLENRDCKGGTKTGGRVHLMLTPGQSGSAQSGQ
ncbi:LptA/OstA family protein [Jiella sp. M17.18]|uniref:LptA/OstA family protein n=1 Tax=Jiella sp. M17.18 TaxID=3234247 RepID=UPI0034DF6B4F